MFDDIILYVNEEYARLSKEVPKGEAQDVGVYMRLLQKYRVEFETTLENITVSLVNLNKANATVYKDVALQAINSGLANKTLVRNLKKAIKMNREFDTPAFSDNLVAACMNPNTLRITSRGSTVLVRILLNETAGSTEDWAGAVKSMRDSLKAEKGKVLRTPDVASRAWKNLLYKPAREGTKVTARYQDKRGRWRKRDVTDENIARYWSTISKRMSASGKLAPYWEILDKGSSIMGGSGTPYPENKPTRFVDNTITELETILSIQVLLKLAAISNQIKVVTEEKVQVARALADIMAEIERVSFGNVSTEEKIQLFILKVTAWEQKHGLQASKVKMARVIEALRNGTVQSLMTAAGRIELTAPGAGLRYRPYISSNISGFEV
jgi:hypothetical protein